MGFVCVCVHVSAFVSWLVAFCFILNWLWGGEVGGEEEGMASLSQLKGYDWQCACLYFR